MNLVTSRKTERHLVERFDQLSEQLVAEVQATGAVVREGTVLLCLLAVLALGITALAVSR